MNRILTVAFLTIACGGLAACSSSPGPNCTAHASQVCADSAVYWQDSCGARQEKVQDCTDGCAADGVTCASTGCTGDNCPCVAAEDCPEGQGCHYAEGLCGACRVSSECRTGQACAQGACQGCQTSPDCGGGLCTAGLCTACDHPTDDQRCRDEYVDPDYTCLMDGECGPNDACRTGLDCQPLDQVCSSQGRCVDCTSSFDCLDPQVGSYPQGTLCVEGRCVAETCADSSVCPADRPICADLVCRGCANDAECLAREGVQAGFVCNTASGGCVAGNCYPPANACGQVGAEICGLDFVCRACAEDTECRLSMGSEAARCESGACVLGCSEADACAPGWICDDTHRCRTCATNAECSSAYSSAFLCIDALCLEAECNADRACGLGRVCDGTLHICRDCRGHGECPQGSVCDLAGAGGTGRCYPGECTQAIQDDQCSSMLCVANQCMPCSEVQTCGPGRVCDSGVCIPGDCVPATQTAQCTSENRPICGPDNLCRACLDDAECLALEGLPSGYVCNPGTGQCLPGDCLPAGSACGPLGDGICGDDLVCRGCLSDQECRLSMQADGAVCEAGACLLGCDQAIACPAGWICGADHRCRTCFDNTECSSAYSSAFLCIDAQCVQAECNGERPCGLGRVCDPAVYTCQDCRDHADCGPGSVCDLADEGGTGRCFVGECTQSTQSSLCASRLCSSYACVACDAALTCGPGRVCDAGVCVVGECIPADQRAQCLTANRPICGGDGHCRACLSHAECLEREGSMAGWVCDALSGQCLAGDCLPAGSACGDGGSWICGQDLICRACQGDAECADSMNNTSATCEAGTCSLGCESAVGCQAGWVCGADHRCHTCSSNADCATAYSSSFLCIESQCMQAECNTEKPCTLGRVCEDGLHICRDCASHAECGPGAVCDLTSMDGTGRCFPGECTPAVQEAQCVSGLCAENACVACDATHPCGLARVCEGGACVHGQCTVATQDQDCDSHLCVSHGCLGCYTLRDDCGPGRICELSTHRCWDGECLENTHCPANLICDAGARACRACGGDQDCLAHGYPIGTICNAGACEAGCTDHAQCASNWCQAGRCLSCDEDTDCQAGRIAQCREGDGVCVPGTCAEDGDCGTPAGCNPALPERCCRENRCVIPQGGGTSYACATLPKTLGTACDDTSPCLDADQCDGAGNCAGTQAHCPPISGAPCVENRCRVADGVCYLEVLGASCYIDGTCYADGFVNASRCQQCITGRTTWENISNTNCGTELGLPDRLCNTYECNLGTCGVTGQTNSGGACTDEGIACTNDTCSGGSCLHAPLDARCGGGTPRCCAGTGCRQCCTAGHCDDGNQCTTDSCDANGNCVHAGVANGTSCTQVANGVCYNGTCVRCYTSSHCNDGNSCTSDVCSGNVCSNPAVADMTSCSGGKCCGGTCYAGNCCGNANCSGCTGTASACSNFGSSSSCTSQSGCSWIDHGSCYVNPACKNEVFLEGDPRNEWLEALAATDPDKAGCLTCVCANCTTSSGCDGCSANCCEWSSNYDCLGTHAACATYGTSSVCSAQVGCHWRTCVSHTCQ